MSVTKPNLESIVIRTELRPGDIGYITYRHGVIYNEEYGYGIAFESYVASGLHDFFQKYNKANNRVWVCEDDGKIIGFLLLMNRGTAAQLRYFYLEKEYRGIGLGKKLMSLYMDALHEFGYRSSFLWTTKDLSSAASLYTRNGFHLDEEKTSIAFGKSVIEQKYILEL